MKNYVIKLAENSFRGSLKAYYRILSCFSKPEFNVNKFEFEDFDVEFNEDTLEIPLPRMRKLNPVYTLVRPMEFHPKVSINKMRQFKSLLRWRELTLKSSVVFRNYPLGFSAKLRSFDKPELALKLPPKVLAINGTDIRLKNKVKTNEEIVKVLPYVRKAEKKKLTRIPVIKRPMYKSTFSRDEMRAIKEEVAKQNKTRRVNIKVFEIYDKFYLNFYSSVRQAPGSKNLECTFNSQVKHKKPGKNYYLIIGQRIDTNEHIKAIVDSSDIKKENSG